MYTYCFLTFRNILDHEGIVQKNSSKGAAISINTVQYCRKQREIKFEETVNIHVQLCLIQRKNWSFFIPLMHVYVRNRLLQYYTDDEVFKFDHIVPYDVQLYLSTASRDNNGPRFLKSYPKDPELCPNTVERLAMYMYLYGSRSKNDFCLVSCRLIRFVWMCF